MFYIPDHICPYSLIQLGRGSSLKLQRLIKCSNKNKLDSGTKSDEGLILYVEWDVEKM